VFLGGTVARRKKQENMALLLIKAPWWISALLGAFTYYFLVVYIPSIEPESFGLKIIQPSAYMFGRLLAFGFALLAIISVIYSWKMKPKTMVPDIGREMPRVATPVSNVQEGNTTPKKELQPFEDRAANGDIKPQEITEKLIREIEWKNFENLCCAFFLEKGIKAETTGIGADGGVDINLYKEGSDCPSIIVQCKSRSSSKVGVKPVREFFGVMASEEVKKGFFMATGDFTSDAIDFAKGKSLDLVSGKRFFDLIKKLPSQSQMRLLKVATKGDYKVPSCASCDLKMVRRTKRGGGSPFWGCSNYPRCKSTIKIARSK